MENERMFQIFDNFRIVVRKNGLQTYVLIEPDNAVARLDVEKCKNKKKMVISCEYRV